MFENSNRVEQHGCIVCGKLTNLLVVYSPSGKMIGCTAISPGVHVVPDDARPLAACDRHAGAEVEKALTNHYPGMDQEDNQEEY